MPLIQLLDFLQTKELRFTKADAFEDIQEGYIGLEAILKTLPADATDDLRSKTKKEIENLNQECFVSCWHLSSSESLAMWKVYGIHNFSVALVSNVESVMAIGDDYCKNEPVSCVMGEVIYDNYIEDGKANTKTIGCTIKDTQPPLPESVLTLFMKANAYSYEREWRFIIHKSNADEKALAVNVGNLEEFIDAIYVSPEAPDWMVNSIQTLLSVQFNLPNIKVSRSPLSKHFSI
jgi:hypothetical protein